MTTLNAGIEKGDSAVGLLLKDKDFAKKLEQTVTDLNSVASTLAKATQNFDQSSLGKLMTNDEAYKSLNQTLEEIRKGVSQLSTGDGTIGKLAKDDKVYRQISAALDSVQKLLDDYREQSPVLTFLGAVFGAL
jgi:phospholipid/cholesterol/gamma-HCH transport system substrate-binding protein